MIIDPLKLATLICSRFEGCVLHAYDDADHHCRPIQPGDEVHGTLTIGWGHTRGVRPGQTCTPEEAEAWLQEDVAEAHGQVMKRLPDAEDLEPHQIAALTSWVYNAGPGPLLPGKHLRQAVEEDRLEDVPAAFLEWNKRRDKRTGQLRVEAGLVKRREVESVVWDLPFWLSKLRGYADRTLPQLDNVAMTGVLQALLFLAGHDPGAIDGRYGPRTRAAADALHRAAGSEPCGRLCADLITWIEEALERAQKGSPHA